MPSLLKNLEQRFSASRYLRGSRSTDLIRPGGSTREWLVARELCLYATIDCAGVPASKRAGLVEIAVRRLAPFPDPECHVVWTDRAAMAWIWPRSRMMPDEEGVPLRTDADSVYPESVFLGAPATAAQQLQQVSSGVEGRIWSDGVLVASRWWPEVPDAQEWASFCRGAGAAPGDVPAPSPFELQPRPWATQREGVAWARWQRLQPTLALAASFAVAAALAWQLGSLARIALARAAVARDTAALNAQLGGILTAREHALEYAADTDKLLSLRPPLAQVVLMARMSELLKDAKGQIVAWSMPQRGRLEVTLKMAKPDPEALVKTLEGSGLLTGVTANGGGAGEIKLQGQIVAATAGAGR